jgi:hypothetical protein
LPSRQPLEVAGRGGDRIVGQKRPVVGHDRDDGPAHPLFGRCGAEDRHDVVEEFARPRLGSDPQGGAQLGAEALEDSRSPSVDRPHRRAGRGDRGHGAAVPHPGRCGLRASEPWRTRRLRNRRRSRCAQRPPLCSGPRPGHGPGGGVLTEETRVALCRCGASQNKPFCDNSHRLIASAAERGYERRIGKRGRWRRV